MSECNTDLKKLGGAYPRSCAWCNLGPCKKYAPENKNVYGEHDLTFDKMTLHEYIECVRITRRGLKKYGVMPDNLVLTVPTDYQKLKGHDMVSLSESRLDGILLSADNETSGRWGRLVHVPTWQNLLVECRTYRMDWEKHEMPTRYMDIGNCVIEMDDRDEKSGGASHHYTIVVPGTNDGVKTMNIRQDINFQHGPVKEVGANGVPDTAVLTVLVDRLTAFQEGPYNCEENARALYHLQQAGLALCARTRNREARGVEGTSEV